MAEQPSPGWRDSAGLKAHFSHEIDDDAALASWIKKWAKPAVHFAVLVV
jgi:hypothetical protein